MLSKLNPFQKPSVRVLAQQELEDAQRQLLAAQSAYEYAKTMAMYHEARIKRLTEYLKQGENNV